MFPGPRPHYETYFGMVDVGPGRALWFRYTLLDGARREAATWAVFFDGDRVTQAKAARPLEELETGDPGAYRHSGASLHAAGAEGSAGTIAWELKWEDRGRHFSHVPPLARTLGLAKSSYHCPLADLRVSGRVHVADEEFEVSGVTGMLGHIEGARTAHGWAWAHCN
ncbi:MAG: hypothetical protein HY303_01740, partial [Candidatus Wallbacteria bacterium]|nr:hypothetical protein [Candidatus Wallbacteria bacterium]